MTFLLPRSLILVLLGGWLLLHSPAPATAAGEIKVVSGIAPLTFLVEKIGGPHVQATTLMPAGQDPHTFEPRPGQISALSRADLYFSLAMPFERTLLARLPRHPRATPRIVDVTQGINKLPMPEHDHDHTHRHGSDDDHQHGELDPHVWLAPLHLLSIGEHIRESLVAADPDHAAAYRENHRRLQVVIEELHHRNRELLAPLAGQIFFVHHPAFGYFANAYDLRQKSVEISGQSPAPRQLIRLVEEARRDGVRVIFVQPQFDQRSAAAVARAIDGRVIPLDPLAKDVLANLEHIAQILRQTMDPDGKP